MERIVGELSYKPINTIGIGGFAYVFHGLYRNSLPVAVKRAQRRYGKYGADEENQHLQLVRDTNHPNILRFIHSEMNDDFTFIATELCEGTLQHYIKEEYRGPRFNDEREMLHQLTKAVVYLHGRGIVHRDIKPTKILIYVAGADRSTPQIKLNIPSSAKTLKAGREDFTNTNSANPSGTIGWMAAEMYESERFDSKVDIWALGCVFAYSLTGGKHPFGEDVIERIDRTRKGSNMLLTIKDLKRPYCDEHSTFELIESMLFMESSERPTADKVLCHVFFNDPNFGMLDREKSKQNSQLSYDKTNIIGKGKFSSVFHGFYSGSFPVAVIRKRKLPNWNDSDFNEQLQLLQVLQHPNIVRCFDGDASVDDYFTILATELCDGNLRDYFEGSKFQGSQFKNEQEMLHQLTKGVTYLHENGIVHRDIKPTNVLIYLAADNNGSIMPQIKLDIPSIGKMTEREDYTNTSVANPHEAREQLAPEMSDSERLDFKADIWELGCVFVYTLSGGKQFGDADPEWRRIGITNKRNMCLPIEDLKKPYCDDIIVLELIQSMLEMEPSRRPSAKKVLDNFFFEDLNIVAIPKAKTSRQVGDHLIYYFGSNDCVLGEGRGGTFVFVGLWKDPLLGGSDVKVQKVAVKRMLKNPSDPTNKDKFKREVDNLLKVQEHRNIIQYYTHHEADIDFWYIVTELCHGTLESWLKKNYQGPPIRDERNILFQVTEGLAFVHDKGIAHRDIKPPNILIYIPEVGEPLMKLADFGISSNITEEGFKNTDKDQPMGTCSFMPLEMYKFDRCDLKVDIYGLGVVFGQVLSKDRREIFDRTICDEGSTMVLKLGDFKPPYSNNLFAFNLIKSMGNVKPEERPTAQQILINIFFL